MEVATVIALSQNNIKSLANVAPELDWWAFHDDHRT